MALQQFVKQTAQAGSTAVQATLATEQNQMKAQASAETPVQLVNSFSKGGANHKSTIPAAGPVSRAMVLNEHERETLSSLAAIQIRYNRPAEAVPYLMMLRRTDPTDKQAGRLLALALMKLGNWQQAEAILEEMYGLPNGSEKEDGGFLYFYHSLVAFKQKNVSAARQWLQRFRALVTGGGSE